MTISQEEPLPPRVDDNLENGLIYLAIMVIAPILTVEVFLGLLALCLIFLMRMGVQIPKMQPQVPHTCVGSSPTHLKADNEQEGMRPPWEPSISIFFSCYVKEKLSICYPQRYTITKNRKLPLTYVVALITCFYLCSLLKSH